MPEPSARPMDRDGAGGPSDPSSSDVLLDVRDLSVTFGTGPGAAMAVRGVGFAIAPGEAVAIVGESGSGKSVSVMALLRLLPSTAVVTGTASLRGVDLLRLDPAGLRSVRGRDISMIFQDPLSSLDPVMTVGDQVVEALTVHRGIRGGTARARAVQLLEMVGIPEAARRVRHYPHQFSGGMRQRVMIAAALATEPALLIADEPTTALDVTIQAQILDLLRELRQTHGTAILLITHDLGVTAELVDRLYVMYAGRFVEQGMLGDVLGRPRHPYTSGLLAASPRIDREPSDVLIPIAGAPPDVRTESTGCAFAPRCSSVHARCLVERPSLLPTGGSGHAACWLVEETGS